jgi:amino acid permease
VDLLTLGVAVIVALLSFPSEMGRLAHAAAFSTAAFCFLVATLVYYGSVEIAGGLFTNATAAPQWWPRTGKGGDGTGAGYASALGSALPVILYSFGCQFQVFDIYVGVIQGRDGNRKGDGVAGKGVAGNGVAGNGVAGSGVAGNGVAGGGVAYFVPSVVGAVVAMTLLFSIVGLFGVFAFPGQAKAVSGGAEE